MVVMKFFTYKELEKLYYIRIFGKDFYITKPVERMKKVTANYSFNQIESSWKRHGASKPLMDHLEFLSVCPESWEIEFKRTWMIYACCLLEHGKEKEAAAIIDKYLYLFDPNNISYYLPVANWCYDHGYRDIPYIEKANSIFTMLEEDRKNKTFENKIKNAKSIAVVVNSSSEVGRKTGEEIDNHDIVIRLNSYVNEGYEEDYGKRTDIWVRGFNNQTIIRYPMHEYAYGMFVNDIWHFNFPIHDFYTYSVNDDVSFGYFNFEMKQAIYDLMPHFYSHPTLGCQTLLILYHLLGSFDKVDCYAFSFLTPEKKWDYYYKNYEVNVGPKKAKNEYYQHDFPGEMKLLRSLYKK